MKCFYCDKDLDLTGKHGAYMHSVTHGIYMHEKCWAKYEKLMGEGKIKKLYDKEELQALSHHK